MAVLESSVGSYVVVVECSNEVGGLTFHSARLHHLFGKLIDTDTATQVKSDIKCEVT